MYLPDNKIPSKEELLLMVLDAAGLDPYFHTIVTFDDTGVKKPAKEPFLKACQQLKVKPNECLMVGDWPERDIEGAKAIGIKTCWAKYGGQNKEANADYEIENILELLSCIYK